VRTALAALSGALACAASLAYGGAIAPLEFVPPAPGTYRLEHIMRAPEGTVLDVDDRPRPLSEFTSGRITLLAFIYTHCSDAWGCPLAYEVMDALKAEIDREAGLRAKLRFVSLSFDPDRDTPEVMQVYGGSHVVDRYGMPWFFLTTPSPRELKPLLEGFDQGLSVVLDENGKPTAMLSHLLKVFLIDRAGEVREIYSTVWLQPKVVLNDIRTLLLEEGAR
jgi:cytochrome oxidase Cu insertion factor (SCO1/SenC/PrrC family)